MLSTMSPSYLYPDGRSINPDLSWAVQVLLVPMLIMMLMLILMLILTLPLARRPPRTT